jgi:hypothetical protein
MLKVGLGGARMLKRLAYGLAGLSAGLLFAIVVLSFYATPEDSAIDVWDIVGAGPGQPDLTDLVNEEELRAFSEECKAATGEYRPGEITYPRTLPAEMGEAANYEAAISIRRPALLPSGDIDAVDPAEEPVSVQCLVGARLVAVDDGLTVKEPDVAGDGGWVYQRFAPDGALDWAWSVTPTTPRDGTVNLELRPAIKGLDVTQVSQGRTGVYPSEVIVRSSWPQRTAHWMQSNGPPLKYIWGVLVACLMGALALFRELRGQKGVSWRPRRPAGRSTATGG